MFGLGLLEIGLLVGLLILLFGSDRVFGIAGRLFKGYRQVNTVKEKLRRPFNPLDFFNPKDKDPR